MLKSPSNIVFIYWVGYKIYIEVRKKMKLVAVN